MGLHTIEAKMKTKKRENNIAFLKTDKTKLALEVFLEKIEQLKEEIIKGGNSNDLSKIFKEK